MKTFTAKKETVERQWFLIDATDMVLGRMASEIAKRLRGKHKPVYTPHVDTGDYIIVTNIDKVRVTGSKTEGKLYYRHSGHMGGLKTKTFEKMMEGTPERVLEIAVKGMLPKNSLGRDMFRKLKVYSGPDHHHHAQQPKVLQLFGEKE